jgi:CDP-diacylglycerol--serine O-phosphatidyltransferase
MAFQADYRGAFLFIIISAVFDFLDGMAARLLKAYSPIGKDLDSLADDVSFGLAPSVIVFSLLRGMDYPSYLSGVASFIPYLAFIIAVFSALRLARFNNDNRQTHSFIGLPVPANALFWASLVTGIHSCSQINTPHTPYIIVLLIGLFSWLLVSNIPMFSLKFKNLSWKDNKVSFIFLLVCIPLLWIFGILSFAIIIVWYILLSLFTSKRE